MRRRTRRILKWAGTVGVGVMAVGAFLSFYWTLSIGWRSWHLTISSFLADLMWYPRDDVTEFDVSWSVDLLYLEDLVWPRWIDSPWVVGLELPLYIPVLVTAIPTFLLWRADRRRPPGRCQACGYDLTGNKSGTCPECGAKSDTTS